MTAYDTNTVQLLAETGETFYQLGKFIFAAGIATIIGLGFASATDEAKARIKRLALITLLAAPAMSATACNLTMSVGNEAIRTIEQARYAIIEEVNRPGQIEKLKPSSIFKDYDLNPSKVALGKEYK